MSNNIPIHSTKSIIKATMVATVSAVVIVGCFVLPVEYNIDPTGLGEALGLSKLATSTESSKAQITKVEVEQRSDKVNITIPAGRGLEYKLLMEKHAHMTYEWTTVGQQVLYFDFHGEPRGDTTGYFESFAITTSNNMKGSLTTPFAGSHGWYWKNTTNKDIVVNLSITGRYTIKG